jgi:RNA polymerase sigma-32 factor
MRMRAGLPSPSHPRPRPRAAERDRFDAADELRLCHRWRDHNDVAALHALVDAHLWLVRSIANEFRHAGPERDDLIQEGQLGLLIAARRFDAAKEARLATYAGYWIRACMMELAMRTRGAVRIGTTRAQRRIFFGLGRAQRELERSGEQVTTAALAAQLVVDEAELEAMTARLHNRDPSLDAPCCGGGSPLGALLPGGSATPEEALGEAEQEHGRRRALAEALAGIGERERQILEARHLGDDGGPTLAELGRRFGISRERVRQLELRAKAKLRVFCGVHGPMPMVEQEEMSLQ